MQSHPEIRGNWGGGGKSSLEKRTGCSHRRLTFHIGPSTVTVTGTQLMLEAPPSALCSLPPPRKATVAKLGLWDDSSVQEMNSSDRLAGMKTQFQTSAAKLDGFALSAGREAPRTTQNQVQRDDKWKQTQRHHLAMAIVTVRPLLCFTLKNTVNSRKGQGLSSPKVSPTLAGHLYSTTFYLLLSMHQIIKSNY